MQERYVPLADSRKSPISGARRLGAVAPDKLVGVTVLVRSRRSGARMRGADARSGALRDGLTRLARDQYTAEHGARPEDIATIEAFAAHNDLVVSEASLAKRTVKLEGTVAAMSSAFSVELTREETPHGIEYRGRTGTILVPAPIAPVVQGVFGLDNRPQAFPHFCLAEPRAEIRAQRSYLPTEVAALYRFPRDLDGRGQTVAIVELGGGYRRDDLDRYFAEIGAPPPVVAGVPVDGGRNRPTGDASGPDAEVMLDVEIVGAVAPRARIAVYFAPNTSQGFLDAVLAAVHDDARRPSVVSISWGAPEVSWTRQSLRAMDEAFQAAARLGMSVCAASGDAGSSDGVGDGRSHVDFPASSPHVLACGGTRLERWRTGRLRERAWGGSRSPGATGGGVSEVFDLPDWQSAVGVPSSPNPDHRRGRGVPDVSGNADPDTGYRIRVDGVEGLIGGTSAVAPLVAGLLALINQRIGGSVGFISPLIYKRSAARLFRDVTSGTNGAFSARPGWDACTGLGSPIGEALTDALGGAPSSRSPSEAPTVRRPRVA